MKPKKMAKKINMILAMSILMVTLTGSMVFASTLANYGTIDGDHFYYWAQTNSTSCSSAFYWYNSVYSSNPVYKNNGKHLNIFTNAYNSSGTWKDQFVSINQHTEASTYLGGSYYKYISHYVIESDSNYSTLWNTYLTVYR